MHLNGYDGHHRPHPIGLGTVIALHAAVVALIATMPGETIKRLLPQPPMKIFDVPLAKPTIPPPSPQPAEQRSDRVDMPPAQIDLPTAPTFFDLPPLPPIDPTQGEVGQDRLLEPVTVDAKVDPRFAGQMQPPFPDSMRRAGMEGVVSVRVLIGTDGRVQDASLAKSSGQQAFDDAVLSQARKRWRFVPATRDGVAIESWKTLVIRFRLVG